MDSCWVALESDPYNYHWLIGGMGKRAECLCSVKGTMTTTKRQRNCPVCEAFKARPLPPEKRTRQRHERHVMRLGR